ncbi:MAG: UbiA family prenyltransferase [Flavobacteriales bacterium]
MSNTDLNNASFFRRFYQYQKERFPFLAHGLLITSFTFSAISYSRISRGVEGFINFQDFGIGVFITLSFFFLVRIFDEFKDKEEDARYRKYLPVPRGLISLKELKIVGWGVGLSQILVIGFFQPQMIYLYAIVLLYLLLMGVEFFVPKWLKKRHLLYIVSHMIIIPLIDFYASGLDWLLEDSVLHIGLIWFFLVSYFNGFVLEFGRKIRTPETEEEGITSYTKLYGTKEGVWAWIALMFLTLLLAIGASLYANYGIISVVILGSLFVLCSLPGWLFIKKPTSKISKLIEYSSGLWTLIMYFSLGGIPMLKAMF